MRAESSASGGRNHLDEDGNRQAHLLNCRVATIIDTEHDGLPMFTTFEHFHRPFFSDCSVL